MTESEYWYNRSSQDVIYGDRQHESAMIRLTQSEEYNLVSMLRPKIFLDGNRWCVLYGENLQEGVCGFGKSPESAIRDFNKSFVAEA